MSLSQVYTAVMSAKVGRSGGRGIYGNHGRVRGVVGYSMQEQNDRVPNYSFGVTSGPTAYRDPKPTRRIEETDESAR